MKLLLAVLCALIILLLLYVLTDAYTKRAVKKQNRQQKRALKKGEEFDGVIIKAKTKEERIRENLDIKATASVGDSAIEVIRREKVFDFFKKGLCYAFLVVAAVLVVIPFYWMFVVSLKTEAEIELPNPTLLPGWKEYPLALSNFPLAMDRLNGFTLMLNTIWVAICSTIGTLVTTVMAAFAFSRIKFKGRELLFTIFLSTMMIPGEMMVITNFITVSRMKDITSLNLANLDLSIQGLKLAYENMVSIKGTFSALIIPFLISVYYIYLLRQNFKQIPDELYYAAKVDGTSDLKYLFKVMIPIAMPTLITITILKAMGSWNAYAWPKLMSAGSKNNINLITSGLRTSFTDGEGRTSQGLQMAASTIVTLPLLFVFIFLRKYIMRGVSRSGIKG